MQIANVFSYFARTKIVQKEFKKKASQSKKFLQFLPLWSSELKNYAQLFLQLY